MKVIIQGIKMEMDKKLTPAEKEFVDYMEKRGFLLTYYQGEDKNTGGSIKDFKVALKDLFKIKN
jgi:hypothetical protein